MSEDATQRRNRSASNGPAESEIATKSTSQPDNSHEESFESLPEPKRRRPSSLVGLAESAPPSDQGPLTPRPTTATSVALPSPSTPILGENGISHVTYDRQSRDSHNAGTLDSSQSRQQLSASQGSLETSPTINDSSIATGAGPIGLVRIPSLSSIAHNLPSTGLSSSQNPSHKGLSSPSSARSRRSISSRGSSPHASSSSSSSSAGKRRYSSIAVDRAAVSRSASQVPEFRYELVIHQQPGTAAAAGLSPPALSRLPIVPSPILQLRVTDENGNDVGHRHVLQSLPYLVCSCSLVSADEDNSPIDFATEEQRLPPSISGQTSARRPSQPLAMICGTRVYSCSEAVGLDNHPGIFFVFWDTSIRQEGEYRLKFSLIEALPGSPTLTTVISNSFKVVGRAEFPGTVEIATEWTRHMHRQGVNIYLPALGTSSGILPNSNSRTSNV